MVDLSGGSDIYLSASPVVFNDENQSRLHSLRLFVSSFPASSSGDYLTHCYQWCLTVLAIRNRAFRFCSSAQALAWQELFFYKGIPCAGFCEWLEFPQVPFKEPEVSLWLDPPFFYVQYSFLNFIIFWLIREFFLGMKLYDRLNFREVY